MADQTETVLNDICEFRVDATEPVSFYFPISKLRSDEHTDALEEKIDEMNEAGRLVWRIRGCDPTAFGLYLSWNEHHTFNLQFAELNAAKEQKAWLLLGNCWLVAHEMRSNGFRRRVEQAMIDFAKARRGNFPTKKTVRDMEEIIVPSCYLFYELWANIWLFHNIANGYPAADDISLTCNFSAYVISRLAFLGGSDASSRLELRVGEDDLLEDLG